MEILSNSIGSLRHCDLETYNSYIYQKYGFLSSLIKKTSPDKKELESFYKKHSFSSIMSYSDDQRQDYEFGIDFDSSDSKADRRIDCEFLENKDKTCFAFSFETKKGHSVSFLYNKQAKKIDFLDDIKKLKESLKQDNASKINFLCYSQSFYLEEFDLPKVTLDLETNYGSEFLEIDKKLREFTNSNGSGLTMLWGNPGTGKSFYIKHLLQSAKKKTIYVPPYLVGRMADPEILSFLTTQKDVVLVVEDSEEIITSRKDAGNASGVSNLLNLTDGIVSSCLHYKVICTFNTNIINVDPALTRKGRLFLSHEFKPLSIDNTNKLFKHLGKDHISDREMSLADIYNFEHDNKSETVQPKKTKIGF